MTIQIHNSLTRTREPLEPLVPGTVGMYVCGPTVYGDCHIGHLMGPVVFDTIARWVIARGMRVRFVNNITDIDDKIIQRSIETGEDWHSIAKRYTEQYLGFLEELGVETVTDHPRCTDYVEQMVTFIQELIDSGRAYETSDGVYFDVERQPGYGKLSGRKLEDVRSAAPMDASSELHHPADFALWKKAKPNEPTWDSPWGPGRPGWHIECSVMASELLGPSFDIHGGGDDLKFPHHENEIAQSEAHGDAYAKVWMHNGLIQYGGRKISKSDPRMKDPEFAQQFQGRWLLDTYGAPTIRFYLVRSPYGRPVDFQPRSLEGARTALARLHKQLGPLLEEADEVTLDAILERELPTELATMRARFCEAMDDDFNSGEAVAELHLIARLAKSLAGEEQTQALRLLRDLGRLLGILRSADAGMALPAAADERLSKVLDALLKVRLDARSRKDFETGDGVRDLFAQIGVQVQDGADGSTWELADEAGDGQLHELLQGVLVLRQAARERKDFATADGIRDRLAGAGVRLLDGSEESSWEFE